MLLNRVRCEAMEKIRVYFDRNLCRFLPPKESIFLIQTRFCHSITKMQQQIHVFFNIIVAGDFFQVIICAYGA